MADMYFFDNTLHPRPMMYLRLLLLAVLIFFINVNTRADTCDCLWQGSFTRAIDKADFIVSGEIVRSKGNAIDLRIERLMVDKARAGKEFNDTIRIWTDDGKQCRPNVDQFTVNSRWLMALHKITEVPADGFNPNTPNVSYGRLHDYYLSKCGAYWLELHDEFASGNLVNGQRWQWDNKKMNPVLLHLIEGYIKGFVSENVLIQAAKPRPETKKLMNETRKFLKEQK